MKMLKSILISFGIQIIFIIIATVLSHIFPSLKVEFFWVMGVTAGMIIAIIYDRIDKYETSD